MILLKSAIQSEYKKGRIHISNFDPKHLNPNSYTTILGKKLLEVSPVGYCFDTKNLDYNVVEIEIPEEGYILEPGRLYLGASDEEIGSSYYVPMYEGRSSLGRIGLQSHLTAGFGDIGFEMSWTKEIQVIHPVKVYPDMPIGQVFFMLPASREVVDWLDDQKVMLDLQPHELYHYSGQYHDQVGPTLAKKIYR